MAPFRSLEFQYHQRRAFSLLTWCMWVAFVAPELLAAVIGIKCGLVMHYEDQSESACLRHIKTVWWWICIAIIIVGHHSLLVLAPPLNKTLLVFNHILSFMPIHIHTLFLFPIPPV